MPFVIGLNRGEAFCARSEASTGTEADLTGSTIQPSRPVGVANGNSCANIPTDVSFCDHVFEVAQPVQSWGTRAFATNLPNRPTGSVYRVLASENGTLVSVDGSVLGTIDRGEFLDFGPVTGSHEFVGERRGVPCPSS